MSFATISQRSFPRSASHKLDARCGTHRRFKLPKDERAAAMLEVLTVHGRRFPRQPCIVPEYREFHKYMLKTGAKVPPRTTMNEIQAFACFCQKSTSVYIKPLCVSKKADSESCSPPIPKDGTLSTVPAGVHSGILEGASILDLSIWLTEHTSKPAPEPISQRRSHEVSSMSRRRLSSNIPALQGHLSFSISQEACTNTSIGTPGFEDLFPINSCSTPITPLDQIIHTPLCPPLLQSPDTRKKTLVDSGTYRSPTSKIFMPRNAVSRVSDNIRRRLSVVAPPEAMPMHAPRRLSYSLTYGKTRSPLTRRNGPLSSEMLNSCIETELLASPLVILPSSSVNRLSANCVEESRYGQHLPLSSLGSPHAM
ncbi:hypothetical protein BDZ97DRAFT_1792644 [Flammula alnicola]|nr:hypothetical protein BDZ97DRAFT_1792644 [Flammula alnicola]